MVCTVTVLSFLLSCISSLRHNIFCQDLQCHRNIHLLPKPPLCGIAKPVTKIMGGVNARVGEFPWIVTLYIEKTSLLGSRSKVCDGVIVTSRYILTAAHCVYKYIPCDHKEEYSMYVRVGEYNVKTCSMWKPVEIAVESTTLHPQFNYKTAENDIALLRLAKDIRFYSLVYPICLPYTCDVVNQNLLQKQLIMAGWGFLQESPVRVEATILQKIPMKVVSSTSCQKALSRDVKVHPGKQLCTVGEHGFQQNSCRGDSGGPLMTRVGLSTYAVGLASMAVECRPSNPFRKPNLFTLTGPYMEWILDTIS